MEKSEKNSYIDWCSRGASSLSAKDDMLGRIRRALGRGPGNPGHAAMLGSPLPPARIEGVIPPIPPEELISKFEAELTRVGGAVHRASSPAELDGIVQEILESSQAKSVVMSRNPLVKQVGLLAKLLQWGVSVAEWPGNQGRGFYEAAFTAGVGITGVDFVLAESGSLVLTSHTEGSQLASLAPPVHVALYRRSQAIATLDEVLEKLPASSEPGHPPAGRSVVFVTGPSRTADIEQILIRGVHGPREVHAVLVEENCLAA